MKVEVFQKLQADIEAARLTLRAKKGKDYASARDTLSNFKRMQQLCAILDIQVNRSAWDNAMYFAVFKLDRWCNLRREGRSPENESVLDTVIDGHNYIDLAYGCQLDELEDKNETSV